jgi:hypothetical protein
MTTTWKSDDRESSKQPSNNTISGKLLSSWSRQQKFAMIAGFAILGLLLAVSACSTESAKPALVGIPNSASTAPTPAPASDSAQQTAAASPAPAKKTLKRRPADVTYSDANYGVSFLYPRKYALSSGDKVPADLANAKQESKATSMNFAQPGGVVVATVALPASSYPGTDFASAFFNVNVNRNVSEQECSHFAFVDTRNADAEPVDAEKVKVGPTDMTMTSDFSASAVKQVETQYYHDYEGGACYEYVLGLGTEGYGSDDNIKHVDRDQVFDKLEKILATVKIDPKISPKVDPVGERVAEEGKVSIASGKE